jgi:tetratricopeptide (TPR) repeat protein
VRSSKRYVARALGKEAFVHYYNKKMDLALETVNKSLATYDSDDINENSAEAHWIKGLILIALDKPEDAKVELGWLKKFVDFYHLSKENFSAPLKYFHHLEALILEKENKFEEAENHFGILLDMREQLSFQITYFHYQFFHTEFARFLIRRQKYPQALEEINKCLDFSDLYIPALWTKAEILEKLGDKSRFDIYEKIQELYQDPDGSLSPAKNHWRDRLRIKLMNRPAQPQG